MGRPIVPLPDRPVALYATRQQTLSHRGNDSYRPPIESFRSFASASYRSFASERSQRALAASRSRTMLISTTLFEEPEEYKPPSQAPQPVSEDRAAISGAAATPSVATQEAQLAYRAHVPDVATAQVVATVAPSSQPEVVLPQLASADTAQAASQAVSQAATQLVGKLSAEVERLKPFEQEAMAAHQTISQLQQEMAAARETITRLQGSVASLEAEAERRNDEEEQAEAWSASLHKSRRASTSLLHAALNSTSAAPTGSAPTASSSVGSVVAGAGEIELADVLRTEEAIFGNFESGAEGGRPSSSTGAKAGSSYEGERDGNCRPSGHGELKLPNGDSYVGAFLEGRMEGEGKMQALRNARAVERAAPALLAAPALHLSKPHAPSL